jgi:hypothetical protein
MLSNEDASEKPEDGVRDPSLSSPKSLFIGVTRLLLKLLRRLRLPLLLARDAPLFRLLPLLL